MWTFAVWKMERDFFDHVCRRKKSPKERKLVGHDERKSVVCPEDRVDKSANEGRYEAQWDSEAPNNSKPHADAEVYEADS